MRFLATFFVTSIPPEQVLIFGGLLTCNKSRVLFEVSGRVIESLSVSVFMIIFIPSPDVTPVVDWAQSTN